MKRAPTKKNSFGFTLIEVIIYIGLFAIIIGGGMVAAYGIIQSTDSGSNQVLLQEEANFLLRKVDWAMTGASSFTAGSTLTIIKAGTTYIFDLNGSNLQLTRGAGTPTTLNSSSILVSNLTFTLLGTNGVTTSFTLTTEENGRNVSQDFSTTKYLRQ